MTQNSDSPKPVVHYSAHHEPHLIHRAGWLRAAVLGANDGIVSTASLIVGVASANSSPEQILLAGVAGIIAGAMSMAAGEYVSVSSQSDAEKSDLAREQHELVHNADTELQELKQIYINRGLDAELAFQVAVQLTARDALGAHARDELGITDFSTARPVQAALTSAATFAGGAILPLLSALFAPQNLVIYIVSIASLFSLALLGAIGAKAGGADPVKATMRVTFWGAFAMALTAVIGSLFGAVV